MPNFIYDVVTLPMLADAGPLPDGAIAANYEKAADYAAHSQALYDAKAAFLAGRLFGFSPQASRPVAVGATQQLWVRESDNHPIYFDGTDDHDLLAGGGGGGHTLVNNTTPLTARTNLKVDGTFLRFADVGGQSVLSAPGLQRVFDIRSYGAVGDGTTDDGPAIQAALDALTTAGSGTLYFPETAASWKMGTAIAQSSQSWSSIRVLGEGDAGPIMVAVGNAARAINLTCGAAAGQTLRLDNLTFITGHGSSGGSVSYTGNADCYDVIDTSSTSYYNEISLSRITFIGVWSKACLWRVTGGIVKMRDLAVYSGQGGNDGNVFGPAIYLDHLMHVSMDGVWLIDTITYRGISYTGNTFSAGIGVSPNDPTIGSSSLRIDNLFSTHRFMQTLRVETAAYTGITDVSDSNRRMGHLILRHAKIINQQNFGIWGAEIRIVNCEHVDIDSTYWRILASSGVQIELSNVGNATLKNNTFYSSSGPMEIHADSSCGVLVLDDYLHDVLTSSAAVTEEHIAGVTTSSVGGIAAGATVSQSWRNPTAALVGAQVQYSPVRILEGQGWDTSGSVTRLVQWSEQLRPVAGATVTGLYVMASKVGAGSMTDCFTFDTAGNFHATGNGQFDGSSTAATPVIVGNKGGSAAAGNKILSMQRGGVQKGLLALDASDNPSLSGTIATLSGSSGTGALVYAGDSAGVLLQYTTGNQMVLGTDVTINNQLSVTAAFRVLCFQQVHTQYNSTGSVLPVVQYTAGAHTSITAGANVIDYDFGSSTARTLSWLNTGGPSNVSEVTLTIFRQTTLNFATNTGSPAFADAATVTIVGAPIAGANATITRPMALWVKAGQARFDGDVLLGSSSSSKHGFYGQGPVVRPSAYTLTNAGRSRTMPSTPTAQQVADFVCQMVADDQANGYRG